MTVRILKDSHCLKKISKETRGVGEVLLNMIDKMWSIYRHDEWDEFLGILFEKETFRNELIEYSDTNFLMITLTTPGEFTAINEFPRKMFSRKFRSNKVLK